jgi:hypothetical protein
MNVYDKSYLFAMSFAFMRRFAFVDVDLPEEALYLRLLERWKGNYNLEGLPGAEANDLDAELKALLLDDNALKKRRALGPAIAKDMLHYVGDRYPGKGQNETVLHLLGEAFLLYAVPQLDGLDRAGTKKIREFLRGRFGPADITESILGRIQSLYPHIHDWTISDDSAQPGPAEGNGG